MMINKRLIGTVPDSKPYIAGNVALQWLSLLSNAGMIFSCAWSVSYTHLTLPTN